MNYTFNFNNRVNRVYTELSVGTFIIHYRSQVHNFVAQTRLFKTHRSNTRYCYVLVFFRSLGMGYLIVVPKRLVADTDEVICITLTNMTQPITVYIQLLYNENITLAQIAPYFMEFKYACLTINVRKTFM